MFTKVLKTGLGVVVLGIALVAWLSADHPPGLAESGHELLGQDCLFERFHCRT